MNVFQEALTWMDDIYKDHVKKEIYTQKVWKGKHGYILKEILEVWAYFHLFTLAGEVTTKLPALISLKLVYHSEAKNAKRNSALLAPQRSAILSLIKADIKLVI